MTTTQATTTKRAHEIVIGDRILGIETGLGLASLGKEYKVVDIVDRGCGDCRIVQAFYVKAGGATEGFGPDLFAKYVVAPAPDPSCPCGIGVEEEGDFCALCEQAREWDRALDVAEGMRES